MENFLLEICKIVNNMPNSYSIWTPPMRPGVGYSSDHYLLIDFNDGDGTPDGTNVSTWVRVGNDMKEPPLELQTGLLTSMEQRLQRKKFNDLQAGKPIGVKNDKLNCREEVCEYEVIDDKTIKLSNGQIVLIENIIIA